MFQLKKTFRFEAGHKLTYHDGKCREPHGHSYQLTVCIEKQSLQESGPKKNMVIDFQEISSIVKPMIQTYFDHKWLNDTLDTNSPTSEWIAQWIYRYLKPKLPELTSITIKETATSSVTYT